MLEIQDLRAAYGEFVALDGVTLEVGAGETVALLGANGAGKSTTLRCISRLLRPQGGTVRFEGEDIASWTPQLVVKAGLVQVPEGRQVFPFLTVRENLDLGSYLREARRHRSESLERVYTLLPRLLERADQRAGTLSGGEQQMLAIGRALMARPRMLMLDEPSLGLAPIMVERVMELLAELRAEGLTILLVEQNASLALDIADRAYVVETGRTVMTGDAGTFRDDPSLRRAYLGAAADLVGPPERTTS